MELGNRYSSKIPWIGSLTLITIIGLAPSMADGNMLSIPLAIVLIALLGLYIGLVTAYFNYVYVCVGAVVKTFDKLET